MMRVTVTATAGAPYARDRPPARQQRWRDGIDRDRPGSARMPIHLPSLVAETRSDLTPRREQLSAGRGHCSGRAVRPRRKTTPATTPTSSTDDPVIDALYLGHSGRADFVDVPKLGFVMIDSVGAPGGPAFTDALQGCTR